MKERKSLIDRVREVATKDKLEQLMNKLEIEYEEIEKENNFQNSYDKMGYINKFNSFSDLYEVETLKFKNVEPRELENIRIDYYDNSETKNSEDILLEENLVVA